MNTLIRTDFNEAHPHIGLLLSGYQDNTISADERLEVERHLAECEACRNFLNALEQVREVVSDLYSANDDNAPHRSEYKAVMLRTIYREKMAELEKSRRFFSKEVS